MDTRRFFQRYSGRGVTLTIQLNLACRLRMRGVIPSHKVSSYKQMCLLRIPDVAKPSKALRSLYVPPAVTVHD